jgi:hypothetical protein
MTGSAPLIRRCDVTDERDSERKGTMVYTILYGCMIACLISGKVADGNGQVEFEYAWLGNKYYFICGTVHYAWWGRREMIFSIPS